MKLGSLTIDAPFCQAGLAGYSDRAMRVVARRRGCPYAVTEALLDTIMLAGGEGLRKSIDIADDDHPVAGQIIGSEPDTMAPAAQILHDRGYDVIDLNFACPVKKIKNKARGGHMLRDIPRGHSILRAVRDRLPNATLSVSLRRAFDNSPDNRDALFALLDEAWQLGYAAVRVHGRTVEQKYLGRADWTILRELKQRYPTRNIVGSGDVFTAGDAVRMLTETGVDMVWIARGAIGNPWIFRDSVRLLREQEPRKSTERLRDEETKCAAGDSPTPSLRLSVSSSLSTPVSPSLAPPSIPEQRAALGEHFEIAMQIHGEQLAGRRMRKMGIKYARFHPQSTDVKKAFIEVRSLRDWQSVLTRFYEGNGEGVWPAATAADEVNDDPAMQRCEVV